MFFVVISLLTPSMHAASWIDQSNQIAKEYALENAQRHPEAGSDLGYTEFDSLAIHLEDNMSTKYMAFLSRWEKRLEKEISSAEEPDLLMDLKVLLQSVRDDMEGELLNEKYAELPFFEATRFTYNCLRELINEQTSDSRKQAAVERFKKYAKGHGEFKPLLPAFNSRVLWAQKKFANRKKLYPLKQQIEQYLKDSPEFVKGVKELLEKSGRTDWQAEFQEYEKQAKEHDQFVKDHFLKQARTDYKLPKEVYAHILKTRGIDSSPDDLIRIAKADYKTLYKKFKSIAYEVGTKLKLGKTDPASVIQHLKSKPITDIEKMRAVYVEADQFLTKIIQDRQLVSLPKAPLKIRMAGDAESKALPFPHLTPPPLINNSGIRPEFVVPTATGGEMLFDDFSYPAIAHPLTAHEGRPGHDLQFSTMLDNGTSVIRAQYAFNNVNVEGWGLYAEDLVFPYLPLESQLAGLQMRLWRVARMFLDPQIQLGQIKPEKVLEIYSKELGMSKAVGEMEVRRYTFDDPGQAPSYYYGLKKLLAAKESFKRRQGKKYQEKCFNDGVLSMGLLPIDLIVERLEATLNCAKE